MSARRAYYQERLDRSPGTPDARWDYVYRAGIVKASTKAKGVYSVLLNVSDEQMETWRKTFPSQPRTGYDYGPASPVLAALINEIAMYRDRTLSHVLTRDATDAFRRSGAAKQSIRSHAMATLEDAALHAAAAALAREGVSTGVTINDAVWVARPVQGSWWLLPSRAGDGTIARRRRRRARAQQHGVEQGEVIAPL